MKTVIKHDVFNSPIKSVDKMACYLLVHYLESLGVLCYM